MSIGANKTESLGLKHSNTLGYANELFKAINDFYKKEDEYEYFINVEGRERGIVFRIAHILANKLEDKNNVYVDCEANRCNGKIKVIETGRATPDLIIHKRNSTSYIVVEFKTSKNDIYNDYEKLKYLTSLNKQSENNSELNSPEYDMGFSIILGNDGIIDVKCFINGLEYPYEKIKKEICMLR